MTDLDPFQGVTPPLRAALVRRGFTSLTPVQRAVLDAERVGRNLRISSQTGSGKTVAIGLVLAEALAGNPAEAGPDERPRKPAPRGPRALLIAPTRELAVQVQQELAWLFEGQPDLAVVVVTGGSDLRRERFALARRPGIVVGTPGRMLDHLRSGAFDPASVEQVVLDEADRMLDMGFREELEAILDALPEKRRSHLVSATIPPAVQRLADRFQDEAVTVEGSAPGAANQDIRHTAHLIRPSDRYAALVNTLLATAESRCLVFVERRHEASEIAERLGRDGFAAQPFSGELAQAQRTRALAAFRNGSVGILVSTDVAARGIDVPDIGVVVQATLPVDADTYTHRSGRTGRAGQSGHSVLLVPASAEGRAKWLLGRAGIEATWAPVPGPAQIHKRLRKTFRRSLHARLDAEDGPSESQREYAAHLLEERDPVQVVAALLDMAEPPLACQPMEIAPPTRETRSSRSPRSSGGEFVTFEISWGQRKGATVPRVLSHLCRRGGIEARSVGVIRLASGSSLVEVRREVAEAFERKVAKPDERDPGVHIRRVRGAAPQSGPRGGEARRPEVTRPKRAQAKRGSDRPPGRASGSAKPGGAGAAGTDPRRAKPPRPGAPRVGAPRQDV